MPVIASIALWASLCAVTFSVISLIFLLRYRDTNPEIAALSTRIQEVQLQILDLTDKVTHWRSRDSVRKARQGAEDKANADADAGAEVPYKTQLRRKLMSRQGGGEAA